MSREERKMAQIIASIERMEQEKRRPATPHEAETQADAQGGAASDAARPARTKKSKKGKKAAVKKLKVLTAAGGPAGGGAPASAHKLTPKKRWIQLWSAQLDNLQATQTDEEMPDASQAAQVENRQAREVGDASSLPAAAAAKPAETTNTTLPASTKPVEPKKTAGKTVEKVVSPQQAVVDHKTAEKSMVAAVAKPAAEKPVAVAASCQVTQNPAASATATSTTTTASAVTPASAPAPSGDLRVKTPQNSESSHLSPPLERSSPTTAASISPSAKTKENETPPATAKTAEAKHPPTTTEPKPVGLQQPKQQPKQQPSRSTLEKKESSSSVLTNASSGSIGSSAGPVGSEKRREATPPASRERGRKRSLERASDAPLSEEAKRRAERRRKRKSNWDVGDPRHGGSPAGATELTPSAAAAAANQLSFAKFPPSGRPTWRHSQSLVDMKPSHFQGRSSFHNNPAAGRRSFHHSSSMPLDRSRSAGRSSRYGGGNGSAYR